MRSRLLALTCIFAALCSPAQTVEQSIRKLPEHPRFFQFSFFPGISTNGLASASFVNDFSLNLFGGLSAGNRILELGLITNSNMRKVSGIQIAGLANLIGTNAFLHLTPTEERDLIETGTESTNRGIQIAGLVNYVRDNSYTIQLAGGLNVVGLDFQGSQFAGIGNSAGGNTRGAQLAGFYNIAHESMAGFQISTSFNYTSGQLSGTQMGVVNKAFKIDGKNSMPATRSRGMQLGIVNLSANMNGIQIGLINFGGAMRGNQFGLINFFKKVPTKENVRLGTPVGLLNIGSVGSVTRVYFNELFPINIEHTTGNCANCSVSGMGKSDMPYNENWKKLNQNALIVGVDPRYHTWGFGYGFMRVLLNKVVMLDKPTAPRNEKHMLSYGGRFMHLNRGNGLDRSFNLLTRLHFEYGRRKWFGWHYYAGVNINYFLHQEIETGEIYHLRTPIVAEGNVGKYNWSLWPGYSLGIQL